MITRHPKITDDHLRRRAVHYIRQSDEQQVRHNVGSAAVQMDVAPQLEAWGVPRNHQDFVSDQGVSGSVPGLRSGFARVIDYVTAGTHGIVAVAEVSRLTRNNPDLINLIEPAKAQNVLIALGQQLFNPQDPNDEFILLILCANSGRDRRTVSQFNAAARRKKAELGIASTRPPAGYITEGGAWDTTPDPRAHEILQMIWDKALELRSAGAVVRFLRKNNLKVPRSSPQGTTVWVAANRCRILLMLRNEAYAGTLVFGKTAAAPFKPRYPNGGVRMTRRPESEWVRKENHHPAFISLMS
jgi:DNA invertase Pin-like site-specific DNA recombinase